MKYLVSFDAYQGNWYVGELYKKFFDSLSSEFECEYVHMTDFASRYSEPTGYNNNLPSMFNIYNLIVQDKHTKKTFVHSLHDYAVVMLEHLSAIDKLNVVSFSCSSNLTKDIIDKNNGKIKIIPSFYILEHLSDIELIQNTKKLELDRQNKAYFNGLCYGFRAQYYNIFKNSPLVDFRNKNDGKEYQQKSDYYQSIKKYKYGLSLNGAAKICYRDLEYFALRTLNLREPLDIITHDQLKPDVHYKILIDSDIQSKIYEESQFEYIKEKIKNKIIEIDNSGECEYILNESEKWFNNNCLPEKQIDLLKQFIKQSEIS